MGVSALMQGLSDLFSPEFVMFLGNVLLAFACCFVYAEMRSTASRRQCFTSHLLACVRLQLPLGWALAESRGAPRPIRAMMRKTAELLEDGNSLSQALGCRWSCLPTWYIRMIEIGETNGNLGDVLERVNAVDSREEELRMDFIERVAYPLFLCLNVSAIASLISTFILPRWMSMFADMGVSPAVGNDVLSWIGNTLSLAGLVGIVLGVLVLAAIPFPFGPNLEKPFAGFMGLVRFLRRGTPVLGRRYRRAACARWATTVGLLLDAGMPLAEAAARAADVEADAQFLEHAARWTQRLREGKPLPDALEDSRFVPRSMLWELRVAEGSAALPAALRESGERIAKELIQSFGLWLRLLLPFLVLLIGGAVGMFCVGVFSSLTGVLYGLLA